MSSTNQAHKSEGDREFSFWGSSSNTTPFQNVYDQLGGNETRLNIEAEFGETYKRKNFKFEHSPFLNGRVSSDPSSRSKAIAEGQKELMKMMQDMSESSFELSFQDMVVEQVLQQPQPDQNEASIDNTLIQSSSSSRSNEAQLKKPKKKTKKKKNKSNRPGKMLRVESMDSETFLLKMFFPTSFDWMKKTKVQNVSKSKVSPRPSLQEPIKQVDKEWRIKRFFISGDNRGDPEVCSSTDKSRSVDRSFSFSHGCWPLFHYIKSKTKKLGGSIA